MARKKKTNIVRVVGAARDGVTDDSAAIQAALDQARHSSSMPMEMNPQDFARALVLRRINREELLSWVKKNLVVGRDFGHIKGNDGHPISAVPSLWQPGAQQICGLLGLRPAFPDSEKYVDKAVRGEKIEQVVVRCLLYNDRDILVSEGMGARSAVKIKGDWQYVNGKRTRVGDLIEYDVNFAIKMAQKSAHIDATLRAGGLSAIFTQDLEDDQEKNDDDSLIEDHPAEKAWLEAKAIELFGAEAPSVLTALAVRRMRVADGDFGKIKFKHLAYCMEALERRAEEVAAGEPDGHSA